MRRLGHRKPISSRKAGAFVFVLLIIGLVPAALHLSAFVSTTLKYAEAGRQACDKRFHPQYLDRCNIQVDGVSCNYENRSRLKDWYVEVDFACAGTGPQPVMIAPVIEPPSGPSAPSLKPEGLGVINS